MNGIDCELLNLSGDGTSLANRDTHGVLEPTGTTALVCPREDDAARTGLTDRATARRRGAQSTAEVVAVVIHIIDQRARATATCVNGRHCSGLGRGRTLATLEPTRTAVVVGPCVRTASRTL